MGDGSAFSSSTLSNRPQREGALGLEGNLSVTGCIDGGDAVGKRERNRRVESHQCNE